MIHSIEQLADRARIAARAIVASGGELRADFVLKSAGLEHHPQAAYFLRCAAEAAKRQPPEPAPGTCAVCIRRVKWGERRPADPGFKTCTPHRMEQRRNMRRWRAKEGGGTRTRRRLAGLCRCGAEPDDGFKSCARCRRRNTEGARRRRHAQGKG